MNKDGYFKFTVGFKGDSDEKIRAGEFLESLGHKKSPVLVQAIIEYMDTHPEETNHKDTKVNVTLKHTITREEIESIVREVMKQAGGIINCNDTGSEKKDEHATPYDEDYVSKMVDNFGQFFQ